MQKLAESLNYAQSVISDRDESFGKGLQGRKMNPNWSQETLKDEKPSAKFCLLGNKKKRFLHRIMIGDEKWIYFDNSKRRKNHLRSRPIIDVDAKAEYFRKEGNTLYLVGSEGCSVPRAVEIWSNSHRGSLSRTNYPFEPSIARKTTRIWNETA